MNRWKIFVLLFPALVVGVSFGFENISMYKSTSSYTITAIPAGLEVPLSFQSSSPNEHGHWYDEYDLTYRVYDRWLIDSPDVYIDLSQQDRINFVIKPPEGYVIRANETCSLSASVNMYDGSWTTNPFEWYGISGVAEVNGIDKPVDLFSDFGTKVDITRQFSIYYVSDESSLPWKFKSIILSMDVSDMNDTNATYSFGNDMGQFLMNTLTFSSMTDAETDTGIFTFLVPENSCNFIDFVEFSSTWQLSDGQPGYDGKWDLSGDDTVDIEDLRRFCERWLAVD